MGNNATVYLTQAIAGPYDDCAKFANWSVLCGNGREAPGLYSQLVLIPDECTERFRDPKSARYSGPVLSLFWCGFLAATAFRNVSEHKRLCFRFVTHGCKSPTRTDSLRKHANAVAQSCMHKLDGMFMRWYMIHLDVRF